MCFLALSTTFWPDSHRGVFKTESILAATLAAIPNRRVSKYFYIFYIFPFFILFVIYGYERYSHCIPSRALAYFLSTAMLRLMDASTARIASSEAIRRKSFDVHTRIAGESTGGGSIILYVNANNAPKKPLVRSLAIRPCIFRSRYIIQSITQKRNTRVRTRPKQEQEREREITGGGSTKKGGMLYSILHCL